MTSTSARVRLQEPVEQAIARAAGARSFADIATAAILAELWRSRCAATPQALIVGERHPFVVALVVLNAARWAIVPSSKAGQSDAEILLARIALAALDFPAFATPRRVWWTTAPWTIEDGLVSRRSSSSDRPWSAAWLPKSNKSTDRWPRFRLSKRQEGDYVEAFVETGELSMYGITIRRSAP